MNNQNSMAQLRYLEEVAINLRRNGFEIGCIEDQHLPVSWNGSYLCRISGKGSVLYRQEIVDTLGARMELNRVVDIANITREYMAIMEYRRVRGQINFLSEKMTVREFCEAHGLECTIKESQFHVRPARPDEAGLFYAQHPDEDKRLGCIGHVRMDFGKSGNEFWYTWWPRGPEEWNNLTFKSELQKVVDELRETILKNRFTMERFCHTHGGKINGGYVQNYGFIVETEHYR